MPYILFNESRMNKILNVENIKVPVRGEPGAFGAVRKFDINRGIDLYVPHNTPVFTIEPCSVIDVYWFTGEKANPPMPWWNNTMAVLVYGRWSQRYFIYGEITPCVRIDDLLQEGQCIGYIETVLKKDKGLPRSMLHFEAYAGKPIDYNPWKPWTSDADRPKFLLDPTAFLLKMFDEKML